MSGYNHIASVRGSSPRVWGQVDKQIRDVATTGIIPTRMGTSQHLASPIISAGIIPTRMGTRCNHRRCGNRRRDHPHAYGDKLITIIKQIIERGSSPRVWGQVINTYGDTFYAGIIPTRMGTSRACRSGAPVAQDHPHAYGDKLSVTLIHLQN